MKAAPVGRGPRHERSGNTVRDANLAHAPCPYSNDCDLIPLHDGYGREQAVLCRLCALLERRSDLHDDLTGTPGVGW